MPPKVIPKGKREPTFTSGLANSTGNSLHNSSKQFKEYPKSRCPVIGPNRTDKKPAKKFAIGDEVIAWHRESKELHAGGISRRKGFLYDVIFDDGFTGRFHVSRLQKLNRNLGNDQKVSHENVAHLPAFVQSNMRVSSQWNRPEHEVKVKGAEVSPPVESSQF